MADSPSPDSAAAPRWQPLSAIDRRVAGVLVEKAKATPEAYPLSLNAVVTACNQKSNRSPTMELEGDAVQESLDRLRALGAVGLVQGLSRVDRFRHLLYEWLGVDKVELAVMTELLLRGAQTEGELRGRAARMEPITDLAALRPVLDSLKGKGLLVSLTREGRGHVVTHALYQPREMERLQSEYGPLGSAGFDSSTELPERAPVASRPPPAPPATTGKDSSADGAAWRSELRRVQETIAELQGALEECRREIRELRDALGA